MTRSQSLARMLAATLAISALAAPAAGARPADVGPEARQAVTQSSLNARGTDVRAPDQQAPIAGQDLRSPDTADVGKPVNVAPVRPAPVDTRDGDGTPWPTIGLALVGACVALAGTAAMAGRIRRRTSGAAA